MSLDPRPITSEFPVNTATASNQTRPALAALAGGGYTIQWESYIQTYIPGTFDLDVYDVQARRFGAGSAPVGFEFTVNTDPYYTSDDPSAAGLADGGWVVAFYSNNRIVGSYAGGEIALRRFDASGTPLGAEVRVNTTTVSVQDEPAVAALGNGGYVVVWSSAESSDYDSQTDIRGQRYLADGSPAGGEFLVNTTTEGYQDTAQVAGLKGGGFAVVWESGGQDGSGDGIYAQVYTTTGVKLGGEVRVNTTTDENQRRPDVAALANGGFVVVWHSYGQDGSGAGVFFQLFTGMGVAVGGETRVNATTVGDQLQASVAALPDGGFVVTWVSNGQDGSLGGIYQQRFDADGLPVGGETLVNQTTADHQAAPDVAVLADGSYVISWHSFLQDGSGYGIYAREYAAMTVGASGNDSLTGTNAPDRIDGRAGNDTIAGLNGADSLSGGEGDDLVIGGRGNDSLAGDEGNDTLTGSLGNDRMWGGEGNDSLSAGDGNDLLDGGAGDDTLDGGNGQDRLYGGSGRDRLTGGAERDMLRGGADNDRLAGGTGADMLWGDQGNDTLSGGEGPDTLNGGAGNDRLEGGPGADVFVFHRTTAEGSDRIVGWQDGLDRIRIAGGSMADVAISAANGGLDTRVTLSSGTVILIAGVPPDLIDASDFLFA